MKGIERLFSYLSSSEVPPNLREAILFKIEQYRRRNTRLALSLSMGAFLLSAFGLYLTTKMLIGELVTSGLPQYVSLAFSDAGVLALYSKDFLYALLESVPAVAFVGILACTLALSVFFRSTLITLQELQFKMRKEVASI